MKKFLALALALVMTASLARLRRHPITAWQ